MRLYRTEINKIKIHWTTRKTRPHICHEGRSFQKTFFSPLHITDQVPFHKGYQSQGPQIISAAFFFHFNVTQMTEKVVMMSGKKKNPEQHREVDELDLMIFLKSLSFIIYEPRLYGLFVMHAN